VDEATKTDASLVTPLFNFNTFGTAFAGQLEHHQQRCCVRHGLFHSHSVAKSNIFVNKPNETKYFYADATPPDKGSMGHSATP